MKILIRGLFVLALTQMSGCAAAVPFAWADPEFAAGAGLAAALVVFLLGCSVTQPRLERGEGLT